MNSFTVPSIFSVILLAGSLQAAETMTELVPVLVGGEAKLDACSSTGTVSGLKPVPGNFLSVRTGPGVGYARTDKLYPGDRVWLCDRKDGWAGVVYGDGCRVATPIPERGPYSGPCRSGWVSETFLELEAG